jgi:uncharacterized protein YqgV (UPF0045/DUF77 family)
VFKSEFHLATMEANATISLFSAILDIEKHNEIEMEIDPMKTTLTIMEECLSQLQVIHLLVAQKD